MKNTHTSVKSHPMSLSTPHRPMMEIINSPIPMAKSIWGVVISSVLMKFDHLYSLWLMMNAMDRMPTLEICNLCLIFLIIHFTPYNMTHMGENWVITNSPTNNPIIIVILSINLRDTTGWTSTICTCPKTCRWP